ncbi:positive regulation of MHC class I biosynthetic process [Desmophyllum pertusum]|uniref:Positive regulation of MHC class I biosynthetic process n=1 Tax=Desmophyllum pertusum TaxID=174260 RepID=A0A9X0D2L8_9CNID|nr:positive regulation of MHC class I biosynthetic process [Desmophyllum pertusum]
MDWNSFKEFVTPKTFNKLSFVAVLFWIIPGVILLGVFADIDINEPRSDFNCVAKIESKELIKGKCFEQYQKLYNKFGIPVYAFVIVNFSFVGIVCVIYSQIVKSRVDELLQTNNSNLPNPGRKIFIAYCCQLVTRFALGILFIVLPTQLLYPSNFPSNFNCNLTEGSHAVNSSGNIQNTTQSALYECHNQRALKKTFWTNAVSVINGVFVLLILIEFICILARARKGKKFMEDSQFLTDHLKSSERTINDDLILLLPQQLRVRSIESYRDSIIQATRQLSDLRSPFQANPGEGKITKHLTLDQIYMNLVLHPGRVKYDFTEDRLEQLKTYPAPRENLQPIKGPEDIVDAENKNVLIVGRAGIGKTLFCTKFLRDWASGSLFKEHFAVAFLLKFRRFNSVFEKHLNLRELLTHSEYFAQTGRLDDEVWDYILQHPDKVFLIFDGIDEFVDNSSIAKEDANAGFRNSEEEKMPLSALYEKVVSGKLLRGATVLTTTRPGSAVSSVAHLPFKRTFEILGFTYEQVEEYVRRFTEDDKIAREKIWQHICSNINIFSLCYIPVNCFIICSCLLQVLMFYSGSLTGVGLPTKLTQIYKKATKLFFYKHNKQFRDKSLSRKDIESDDLPPEVEEKFKRLREIAFNGIKERRLIFGSNEVQGLEDSDLFHRLPDRQTGPFKHEAQFCVIHLTMQEFFAAKHVTDTMSEAELRRFVSDHIEKDEWHVVMQFVAGLLGDRDELSIEIFTDLLPVITEQVTKQEDDDSEEPHTLTCWPTYDQKHLTMTLIKCIFEVNELDSVVQSKLEQIGFNAVDLSDCDLTPVDSAAVVHVFKNVKQISHMNLRDNLIGTLSCLEIQKLLVNSNCKLNSLNLSRNYAITAKGIKHLSEALANSNCKLNILDLSDNRISDEGIKHLSKALTNSNCKLRILDLSDNHEITDEGIKHLFEALTNSNCKLSRLNLCVNETITDEGIKHLSDALTNSNCKLSSLNLSANKITDEV